MHQHDTIPFQARQGDILIERVDEIPAGAAETKREGDRVILARGEATGHHHAIAEPDVARFATTADAIDAFLRVNRDVAYLRHEEHGAIPLAPGSYRVIGQREYAPGAIRRATD